MELAGPAGVGKSTVSRALTTRCTGVPGTIWGLPVLPLLGHGMQLLPTLFGFWVRSGSLLWDESRHMVRLRTLHRALRQGELSNGRPMIFDEGPIFALVWLRGFGHASLRSDGAAKWWRSTLRDWAGTVDAVVVLEAPDALLARRIRSRPEDHEVKQASDPDIVVWMARFRAALDWVLQQLAAEGGPTIVRVTTDQKSPEHIAEVVTTALNRIRHDN